MTTRRDALVAAGLAKPGRGKFSKEAVAWLDAERAKGVKFSDDDAPVREPREAKPVKESEPTGDGSEFLTKSDFTYPEEEFKAVDENGKEHSMRWVCDTCHVSLVAHGCTSPRILGTIPVTIKRRRQTSTNST